jgi:hypothetical protein
LQTWRRDQFRVGGKEIFEADNGRFPMRQCDTLRQEVTLLSTLYLLFITIGNAS